MNGRYVKPMRNWYQKVLPLVYDDSLSYYEAIERMVAKLNELVEVINAYEDQYKEYVNVELENLKNYVDLQDSKLDEKFQNNISDFRKSVMQILNNYKDEFNEYKNNLMTIIQSYQTQINDFKQWVYDDQKRQDLDIDQKLRILYNAVNALVIQAGVSILDPTTGKWGTAQTAINNIYNYLRYQAFTCGQFDGMQKDCLEWDGVEFTALEFDVYGFYLYGNRLCDCYMFNPYTGLKDKISTVVAQIISKASRGVTAQEYDSRDLTARYYDNLKLTAYNYDFYGLGG